jgi:hypothetical protein
MYLEDKKEEASKEDKKRRTNKPGEANTQPGEDNTQQPMGGKDSGKRSGLPIGVANGRSLESELHINTSNESETVLVLPRPTMLKGDGFSYLRASPLHAKIRLGNANGEITNALTDVDSNVGLIDLELLRASYPDVRINESHSATVKGVGKTKAMGFVVVPVWVDGLAPPDGTGYRKPIKVQTDVEFHVVKDFAAKVLLGLDYILDYSIDLSLPNRLATFGRYGITFQLHCPPHRRFQSVRVFCAKDVTVPGRTIQAISMSSAMANNTDYTFEPTMTAPRGLPTDPQLAFGIMDNTVKHVMFANHSEHPVRITRGQLLGTATAVLFGSTASSTGEKIDWADLIQPSTNRIAPKKLGLSPPSTTAQEETTMDTAGLTSWTQAYMITIDDEMVSMDEDGTVRRRSPRSITEEDVARINAASEKRTKGQLFPDEDLMEESIPIPPLPLPGQKDSGISQELVDCSKKLNTDQKNEIWEIIQEYIDCFSNGSTIGHVIGEKVRIDTGDKPLPPSQGNRPVGPAKRTAISDSIDQLLGWDIIEDSVSSTASPIVMVWQNNKWRFCVDYRALNAITKGDAYPLLRPDYVFSAMANKQYFSTFDAIKGYHQIDIDPADRAKTAFISHRGLYQYKRLPFGLKNAPGQFQRIMDRILGGLRWIAALCYIDDVIIFSNSWGEHIAHIRTFLKSVRTSGLQLSLAKCKFGYDSVKMLGMNISRYGLHTIAEKVQAVMDIAPPRTLGELHRIVGLFGYYRNFIQNFAKVIKPLNDLKRGPKEAAGTSEKIKYTPSTRITWGEDCQGAFDKLKGRLSSSPILAHPLYDRPFILYTDASKDGFGAVLCQIWERSDYLKDDQQGNDMSTFAAAAKELDWKEHYLSDMAFSAVYRRLQKGNEDANGLISDDLGFTLHKDGLLHYRTREGDRVCLPRAKITEALQLAHDSMGHFGRE